MKLTKQLEKNLSDLHDRIAADDPARAASFTEELLQMMEMADHLPRAWPQLPGGETSERYIPHGNYIITYEITPTGVVVKSLFHAGRDLTDTSKR